MIGQIWREMYEDLCCVFLIGFFFSFYGSIGVVFGCFVGFFLGRARGRLANGRNEGGEVGVRDIDWIDICRERTGMVASVLRSAPLELVLFPERISFFEFFLGFSPKRPIIEGI